MDANQKFNNQYLTVMKEYTGKPDKPCPHDTIQECDCNHVKAKRYNQGKKRWTLIDFQALEPLVDVLEYGVSKYGENNWKLGLNKQETIDSLLRHVIALTNNETTDPESKLPHIGHILANAMFLSHLNNKPTLNSINIPSGISQENLELLNSIPNTPQDTSNETWEQYLNRFTSTDIKKPDWITEPKNTNPNWVTDPDHTITYIPPRHHEEP